MKTSVVIADGTFSTNTAPLLGPIDEVVRKAAKIGYDAISATVDRPEAEYIRSFRSPALRLQLDSIHLHTNGELDFYPKILALEGLVGQEISPMWTAWPPTERTSIFPCSSGL